MNLHDTKKIYILHKKWRQFRLPKITIDRAALLRLIIKYYIKGSGITLHKPQKQKERKLVEKKDNGRKLSMSVFNNGMPEKI